MSCPNLNFPQSIFLLDHPNNNSNHAASLLQRYFQRIQICVQLVTLLQCFVIGFDDVIEHFFNILRVQVVQINIVEILLVLNFVQHLLQLLHFTCLFSYLLADFLHPFDPLLFLFAFFLRFFKKRRLFLLLFAHKKIY